MGPAFLNRFGDQFGRPLQSAPASLRPWLQFWQNLVTPHATFFAVCTALLETVLAAGLILGLGRCTVSNAPDRCWAGDSTYLPTEEGWLWS